MKKRILTLLTVNRNTGRNCGTGKGRRNCSGRSRGVPDRDAL